MVGVRRPFAVHDSGTQHRKHGHLPCSSDRLILVNKLADFLCSFPGSTGQNMGINVHSRGNVLVAEAFLSNLNLNALLDHD